MKMATASTLPVKETSTGSEPGSPVQENAHKPREYQLEMLAESLKRNIIIAMDTGSGKTLIATMRIQAELQRCSPDKLVWFCVPSVALAMQQYKSISTQLPLFQPQCKLLTGADNCEFWSEKIWAEVLKDARIIISTHAILFDALTHAFVQMARLSLLIFDEAHHAVKRHPANQIMEHFYHPLPEEKRPWILGLTASPLVGDKVGDLGQLETNLNAISRTPKTHRAELARHVHRPELIPLSFMSKSEGTLSSPAKTSLERVYNSLNIDEDPWVVMMRSDESQKQSHALSKAVINGRTYCHDQIRSLRTRTLYINEELGPQAADIFLHLCISKYRSGNDEISCMPAHIEDAERVYLGGKLEQVLCDPSNHPLVTGLPFSPKVDALIEFLEHEDPDSFTGLVFVKTRAEVAVVSYILANHSGTSKFAIGTFVGTSTSASRKHSIHDLADVRSQKSTLQELREGRKNLVVTTNALEEGIDVIACNVVLCFDMPRTLISFIQRRSVPVHVQSHDRPTVVKSGNSAVMNADCATHIRGRARNTTSRYVLIFERYAKIKASSEWQALEETMKKMYEDEERGLRGHEEEEEFDNRCLHAESTGAKITLANSVSHLYHFTSTLTKDPFVDPRPTFIYEDDEAPPERGRSLAARVILPSILDASVREAQGLKRWKTEKTARGDAAFEAYRALYEAGFLDEHLLPLRKQDEEVEEANTMVELRPSVVDAAGQMQQWPMIASAWANEDSIYASKVVVCNGDVQVMSMFLYLPLQVSQTTPFNIFWDPTITYQVDIVPDVAPQPRSREWGDSARLATELLLTSAFRSRLAKRSEKDFVSLFLPTESSIDPRGWIRKCIGTVKLEDVESCCNMKDIGLIRDMSNNGTANILLDVKYVAREDVIDIEGLKPVEETMIGEESRGNLMILEVHKMSKRADFLHADMGERREPGLRRLLADSCEMDRLPLRYTQFALMIPSILHRVHVGMVVDRLCTTLLSPIEGLNRTLAATAISASSAREPTNYQRLEFLGDSVLKLSASLTLMASHLKYYEDILSRKKDHIVSNGSLARAALRTGLDRFILTESFTGAKWRPMYISQLLKQEAPKPREMSTKILADVIEALIGASFLEGGYETALVCTQIFLPNVPWDNARKSHEIFYRLYSSYPSQEANPYVRLAEQLLDYIFTLKPLVIEAVTHASYQAPGITAPYERLEFLGDAILDNIVTIAAFHHSPPIPVARLHLIRTTLVNADFLGYLCIRHRVLVPHVQHQTSRLNPRNTTTVDEHVPFHLWQILRHTSPTIRSAQQACLARFEVLDSEIQHALESGDRQPWTLLARLEPPKPFSDLIESLLGAIYIDSRGDITGACTAFLERIGLMACLRRVMREEGVKLLHPKEELGQLSDQDDVRYVMGVEGEQGARRHTCRVLVAEKEVAACGDGLKAMEVQTRAAELACQVLRNEGRVLGKKAKRSKAKAEAHARDGVAAEGQVLERQKDRTGNDGTLNEEEDKSGEAQEDDDTNETEGDRGEFDSDDTTDDDTVDGGVDVDMGDADDDERDTNDDDNDEEYMTADE